MIHCDGPPYLATGKPVWIIGLSFDSKTRRLGVAAALQAGRAGVRARLYKAVGMKWRYWKDSDADIQTIQIKAMKK